MDSKKADVSFCTNIQSLDKSYSEVLRRGMSMVHKFIIFLEALQNCARLNTICRRGVPQVQEGRHASQIPGIHTHSRESHLVRLG